MEQEGNILNEEQSNDLINTMVLQEETVGRLYSAFERIFLDMPVWRDLAIAERSHAQWLQALSGNIKDVVVRKSFNIEAVKTSINYVNEKIAEAIQMDSKKAVAISLDIEKALLEKNYLDIFLTDSAEIQRIIAKLKEDTMHHANLLTKINDELSGVGN